MSAFQDRNSSHSLRTAENDTDGNVLKSETTIVPVFQFLSHRVTVENFECLRDLARKKALPECPEDSEEFFEQGTVIFIGSFGQSADLSLHLWLCPNGDREDWDSLTITISNEGIEDLPDFTKLTLLDSKDGMKEISACETVGICKAKRGYVRFFFNWTDLNIGRVGNKLALLVEMRFLRKVLRFGMDSSKKESSQTLHLEVFEYMRHRFFKKDNDRVYIKFGGETVPCSRTLLSCRSPVFDRMLAGYFKEANSDFVALEDIDPDAARVLLEWLQNDKIPRMTEIEWSVWVKIMLVADEFQSEKLVDIAVEQMRAQLFKKNIPLPEIVAVRRLLLEASSQQARKLARECEAYMSAQGAQDPSKLYGVIESTHTSSKA